MRPPLIAALALLLPLAASAQYAEPEVQVQRLSAKEHPPLAEDEPSLLSPDEFYRLKSNASTEEVAVIRIAFKGRWYRSADYLAREKAAALGANALVLVESLGREESGAGATRAYRAFRFANSAGRAVYTTPAEETPPVNREAPPADPVAAPQQPETASAPPPAPRRKHRHFDWVWEKNASVLSHRLGFDASLASKEDWEQLKLYVRENFPAAEYGKLAEARGRRSKVVLDFVKGTVE